jgi:hypothetical protein
VRLFFTPPVLTILTAPLPIAVGVWVFEDGEGALLALGIGWVVAFLSTILWLLFVVPLVLTFGTFKSGEYGWMRVLLSSSLGAFSVGAVFGAFWVSVVPAEAGYLAERSVLNWGLAFSYVGIIAAFFLMRDPFFRQSLEKV